MPARLPTASSIWNSFRSSNKRHIIITGDRKIGKTTLLNELFPASLPYGITTYAVYKTAVYMRENGTSDDITIGIYDDSLPGPENKMRPLKDAFISKGTALLDKLAKSPDEWVSIDEIGYLETECPEYCSAVMSLFEQKRVVAVVRKQPLPFLQSIIERNDVFVIDLDDPFGNNSCVIMASGMGTRFGGNKLMADFHGKPMIQCALDATEGIFKKRVVVTRHTDVAELCRLRGVETIVHDLPHRSDTVRLGMEAIGESDSCVFCPGDQPLLSRETVTSLALSARNDYDKIWRVSCDGTPGAPVLFPEWTYDELHCLPQGKGGSWVMKKHPEKVRAVEIDNQYELVDADTPEILDMLKSHI